MDQLNKKLKNSDIFIDHEPKIPEHPYLPKWIVVLIVAIMSLIVISSVIWGAYLYLNPQSDPEPVACTLEAKACSDGSSVGRIAPDCEFAECLEVIDPIADWQIYRNEEYGFEFRYPSHLISNEIGEVVEFIGETTNITLEHVSISISFDDNSDQLSVTDYYDGSPGYDLFSISNDQYTSIQVAGRSSFKFVPSITLGGDVIVIIPLQDVFLRIQDNGAAFQENGVFNQIISTFRFID